MSPVPVFMRLGGWIFFGTTHLKNKNKRNHTTFLYHLHLITVLREEIKFVIPKKCQIHVVPCE